MKTQEITDLIDRDLEIYDQENLAPRYVPIFHKDKECWRCFVLGDCFGLVAFASISEDKNDEWVHIKSISEDDDFYQLDDGPINMSAGWISSISRCSSILENWLNENCKPGYYVGHEGDEDWKCGYRGLKNISLIMDNLKILHTSETKEFDDLIDEYNSWREETMILSTDLGNNQHYINLKNQPAHRVVPFIIEILRNGSNSVVGILDDKFGILKIKGFLPLNVICDIYINLWDKGLKNLSDEQLDNFRENPDHETLEVLDNIVINYNGKDN